jgi:K+-sensing histidine kinase KdpD
VFYVAALLAVFGSAALLYRVPFIEPAAATPLLVLEVLLIARAWGTGPALAGSTAAGGAFAYYFLESGQFVRDLNDWVAFVAFTVTAIIVGELSARAERRQIEAEEGRREIEQLYQQLGAAFERASEAEAARRSEQLKAALLDALTHNLRTPLTGIKAAVTALLGAPLPDAQVVAGLSKEGRRELLHVIDEESDRLNRFIEGLSAADRQAAASQPASLRSARVDDIVQEALKRADSVLRRHSVRTALEPDAAMLSVDAAAIAEVLYMLLDNASKYSPPGTAISIGASRVDHHQALLTVTDEGAGVPVHYRERVFEKFFRIPGREAIDPRRGGVGLGLPIARRLVESQAGTIWMETPEGGIGTRVVLMLPTPEGAEPPAVKPEEQPAAATVH